MKDPTGRDADNIAFGSTLSNDRHAGKQFRLPDRQSAVRQGLEARRGRRAGRARARPAGRFAPGLPRISDGQLLFLLAHAGACQGAEGWRLAHRDHHERLAAVHRRCRKRRERDPPLHPGERSARGADRAARSSSSTTPGIATYVWVVTNRKTPARKGKVQLIDATSFWVPMRKSLGDKRREIPLDRAQDILKILADFKDGDTRVISKDGKEEEVVVSQDLSDDAFRLSQDHGRATAAAQLSGEPGAHRATRGGKALSRRSPSRRGRAPRARRSRPKGVRCRRRSASSCGGCPNTLFKRPRRVRGRARRRGKQGAVSSCPLLLARLMLSALSERDETAAICRDKDGEP